MYIAGGILSLYIDPPSGMEAVRIAAFKRGFGFPWWIATKRVAPAEYFAHITGRNFRIVCRKFGTKSEHLHKHFLVNIKTRLAFAIGQLMG